MSDVSEQATSECWRLMGAKALLSAGSIAGVINVARPELGLHSIRFNDVPVDWKLIMVGVGSGEHSPAADSNEWQLVDCYVRGRDLVARYQEPLGQPFNLQLYWRALEPSAGSAFTLELIISVQTRLWEAYPWVSVQSELQSLSVAKSDNSLVFEASRNSVYVELPYPGDFSPVNAFDSCGVGWRYGPMFMERGVIRRLRLRGAILSGGQPASTIEELRENLLVEQPPLTA